MKVLLATSNPHKIDEIRAIWSRLRQPGEQAVELVGLDTLDADIPEPVEDGGTFEANASIKAAHYARTTGLICLADDSGLEVDALGGAPGVLSARYSGAQGARAEVDQANNRTLLANLQGVPNERRCARFVCAMALHSGAEGHDAEQPIAVARGTVEGRIIAADQSPCGRNGFGYDPLFYLPEYGKTSAELSPDQKNAISHRGHAARAMWERIQCLCRADRG